MPISPGIMPTYIGIDISKKTFDVSINGTARRFNNTMAGFADFRKQLPSDAYCVMEATGNYGCTLAEYLIAADIPVAVINPLRIKRYAQMNLQRHKTDRADARLIALFAENQQLGSEDQWQPPSDHLNDLRQQQTVVEQLKKQETALLNQIEALSQLPRPSADAIRALKKVLEALRQTIKELEASQCQRVIQTDEKLYRVIQSIPGIGPRAAIGLIIATAFFDSCGTARQLASFIGLCPRPYESGSSIKTAGTIGYSAAPQLRSVLYMCSMSAIRFNTACRALYHRLLSRGKSKKLALIAVAHKLVRQVFAVAERRADFTDMLADKA
jgi:transposase